MPDPFESLHSPVTPVEPDPAFAARLRARVARALTLPKGVTVSDVTLDPAPPAPTGGAAASGVIPYVIVADARRAIDWYVSVLGARRCGRPPRHGRRPGGPRRARLRRRCALSRRRAGPSAATDVAAPDHGRAGDGQPGRRGGRRGPHRARRDRRRRHRRARRCRQPLRPQRGGPRPLRAPVDHLRRGTGSRPGDRAIQRIASDCDGRGRPCSTGTSGYVSLWVPDVERAAAFFGHVLGWQFTPGQRRPGTPGATTLPHTTACGAAKPAAPCSSATRWTTSTRPSATGPGRRRRSRSTAPRNRTGAWPIAPTTRARPSPSSPSRRGRARPGPGPPRDAPGRHRLHHRWRWRLGPHAVPSTGRVLGWRFAPGRVDDGWQVEGVRPTIRHARRPGPCHGGPDVPGGGHRGGRGAGPRGRGGPPPTPERQPYGTTAELRRRPGNPLLPGRALRSAAPGGTRRPEVSPEAGSPGDGPRAPQDRRRFEVVKRGPRGMAPPITTAAECRRNGGLMRRRPLLCVSACATLVAVAVAVSLSGLGAPTAGAAGVTPGPRFGHPLISVHSRDIAQDEHVEQLVRVQPGIPGEEHPFHVDQRASGRCRRPSSTPRDRRRTRRHGSASAGDVSTPPAASPTTH